MRKKDAVKKFERIFDYGFNGKLLSTPRDNKKIRYEFRNREESCFYYTITFKGNHIRLIRTQNVLLDSGEPVNVFFYAISYGFGDEPPPVVITKKDELLKMPYRMYNEFIDEYIRLTPDLHN